MNRVQSFFRVVAVALPLMWILISPEARAQVSDQEPVPGALEYNDQIVKLQNEIGENVLQFMELLNRSRFSEAESTIDPLVMFIYKQTKAVREMPDFKGNTAFRDAAVNLFDFYRQMFDVQYREIVGLMQKKSRTATEEQRIESILQDIGRQEPKFDYEYRTAQDAFAEEFGFELNQNEFQKKLEEKEEN